MDIAPRHFQVLMSKDVLQIEDIPAGQQVIGRKRVAKEMDVKLGNAGLVTSIPDHMLNGRDGWRCAIQVQKNMLVGVLGPEEIDVLR
jgi:hypothetical protein